MSFRDHSLLRIFQISLSSLKASSVDAEMTSASLQLAKLCMSFDFLGTSSDESSDDLAPLHIPSTWRRLIQEPETTTVFVDIYTTRPPPLSTKALECLVQLAAVRRSLFESEADRNRFLSRLLQVSTGFVRGAVGLQHPENMHELCRFFAALKLNYQLMELMAVPEYEQWMECVAGFTVAAFHNKTQYEQDGSLHSSSIFYLISLWSRFVNSLPFLKSSSVPSLLDQYVPLVTKAYIASRLEFCTAAASGAIDDPLEDTEDVMNQLDQFPILCRCEYEQVSNFLLSLLDPRIDLYGRSDGRGGGVPATPSQRAVLEGELTWLVYIIGSIIRGRSTQSEQYSVLDADLSARIFSLLQQMESLQPSSGKLDLAILYFFQQFRHVYIGDEALNYSKVYARLNERVGIGDHFFVLNAIVTKIFSNLKLWANVPVVVERSLSLFQELTQGISSGKLIVKLDATKFLLANHTPLHVAFLSVPANSRLRTKYYHTLTHLLLQNQSQEDAFEAFAAPFGPLQAQVADALGLAVRPGVVPGVACMPSGGGVSGAQGSRQVPGGSLVSTGKPPSRDPGSMQLLIGVARDFRGLAMACNTSRSFGDLFDFLYPAWLHLLIAALDVWYDAPHVTTPILKFFAELANNRAGRIAFDTSSPNGFLLFREISSCIVTFACRVATLPVRDEYRERYKGVWISLNALHRTLGGGYVNFGVFKLYNDPALADALAAALEVALSIPTSELMAFPKLTREYYSLAEVLAKSHISYIVTLDQPRFVSFVKSIEDGVCNALDPVIFSKCCTALDSLLEFQYKSSSKNSPEAISLRKNLEDQPQLYISMLHTFLQMILFEDAPNQYTISRPLLALILIYEPFFEQIKQTLIHAQWGDSRARLIAAFEKLMLDVNRNLEPKNRDKFTHNLSLFRHAFTSTSK